MERKYIGKNSERFVYRLRLAMRWFLERKCWFYSSNAWFLARGSKKY